MLLACPCLGWSQDLSRAHFMHKAEAVHNLKKNAYSSLWFGTYLFLIHTIATAQIVSHSWKVIKKVKSKVRAPMWKHKTMADAVARGGETVGTSAPADNALGNRDRLEATPTTGAVTFNVCHHYFACAPGSMWFKDRHDGPCLIDTGMHCAFRSCYRWRWWRWCWRSWLSSRAPADRDEPRPSYQEWYVAIWRSDLSMPERRPEVLALVRSVHEIPLAQLLTRKKPLISQRVKYF